MINKKLLDILACLFAKDIFEVIDELLKKCKEGILLSWNLNMFEEAKLK